MERNVLVLFLCLVFSFTQRTIAETMTLLTSSNDYQVINLFSNVDDFSIFVEIDAPLASGLYDNPEIISVSYQVTGQLASGTPSGFSSFNLRRVITGDEFYEQGSSLSFEIADFADLSDGVQANELIDNGFVLSFNAREIDNGRFHPALFELNAGGRGLIQNSNNITRLDPLFQVDFGAEYINELTFEPSETTLIRKTVVIERGGSSGSTSVFGVLMLMVFGVYWRLR